jgi:hypothetical protein
MPSVDSVQSGAVTAAISRAASRTGADFDYLLAQARIESGLNPQAQARTSSARGLYQFIDSTWLRTMDKHGAKHGLDWAEQAITAGRVGDPSLRREIMALRDNPETSALMAAELALDNRDGLRTSLGRDPDNSELYLAHFLGLGGAQSFLSALANDPSQIAASLQPAAAGANRAIFYDGHRARTLGEVMEVVREKMGAAAHELPPGGPWPTPNQYAGHGAYARPQRSVPAAPVGAGSQSSMAETLRATFGADATSLGRAGAHVAAAYDKLRVLDL